MYPHIKTASKTQDGTESTDLTKMIGKMDNHSLKYYLKDDYLQAGSKQA